MKGLGNDRTAGLNSFVRLAELMGAKVYIADGGEINFPEDHPLNYGSTGHMFGASSLPLIQDSDFCLVLGCYLLPEVFPYLGDIFSPDAVVVHVDTNPNNIAKNHRVDHSFVCRPAAFIDQLLVALNTNLNSNYETESRRRMERLCTESPVKHSRVEDTYQFTPLSLVSNMMIVQHTCDLATSSSLWQRSFLTITLSLTKHLLIHRLSLV